MTKKSKMTLALASMLGITAGATAVSGFAWFATTKSADIDITNIGVYNNNPSTIDNLHREAKNVIWVTNSPEGWTKLLDEFLSEYYFPNLIPFAD